MPVVQSAADIYCVSSDKLRKKVIAANINVSEADNIPNIMNKPPTAIRFAINLIDRPIPNKAGLDLLSMAVSM